MKKLEENNVYFYIDKNKLIDNFSGFSKLGSVYYPLKSNSNNIILETLKSLMNGNGTDNGFLISQISHYEKLKKSGVEADKMCLINVLAEDKTVEYLYEEGVRFFTFDNLNSLQNYAKYADLSESKLAIRLSSAEAFNDKFTHLGGDTNECLEMVNYLKNKCFDYGISFYLQKDIKSEKNPLEKMLDYIITNFKDSNLNFISIGGVKRYNKINIDVINKAKEQLNINQIILEPGRHLLEDTVDLETKVIRTKTINNKSVLIIKNGIYSGFFDSLLYNKKFEFYFESRTDGKIKIKYEKTNENDHEFFMCGGSSDSGDKLGTMYIDKKYKNELIVQSKFYVKSIGTYFEEFFMPYSEDLNKIYIDKNGGYNYEI